LTERDRGILTPPQQFVSSFYKSKAQSEPGPAPRPGREEAKERGESDGYVKPESR
jgi:hypothetical protein